MRTQLQTLALEFGNYKFHSESIRGTLHYVAEADDPDARPQYVIAETAERLAEKLREPEQPYDPSKPNIARIYDFMLGGKTHFAADREVAQKLLEVYPRMPQLGAVNKKFQARAVRELARLGITQFIDVGSGLPTVLNTHEAARTIQPGARVAYVDNDPVVLRHSDAILATSDGVIAVAGDLRYPSEILCHRDVLRLIDFTRPVAVILGMVFHFYEASVARRIVKQFISGIAPGSYVVMSVARGEEEVGDRVAETYTAGQVYNHPVEVVRTFMMDLELTDPGLTDARRWRGDNQTPGSDTGDHGASVWAAVGKKVTA